MKNKFKSVYKEAEDTYKKPEIVIFDLDGCIMNSDDFVLTKAQAWEKDKEVSNKNDFMAVTKPWKSNANDFSMEYLYQHHDEIQPYKSMFDMFVRYATTNNVAIVTSRFDIMKAKTMMWLERNVIKMYGNDVWRRIHFKTYFNEDKEPTLTYKKRTLLDICKTYDILFMVEDHPQVIEWAKSKNIMVMVPSTGYKNLNGKDLVKS